MSIFKISSWKLSFLFEIFSKLFKKLSLIFISEESNNPFNKKFCVHIGSLCSLLKSSWPHSAKQLSTISLSSFFKSSEFWINKLTTDRTYFSKSCQLIRSKIYNYRFSFFIVVSRFVISSTLFSASLVSSLLNK